MPRAPVTVFSFPVAETLCQLLAHELLLPGIQAVIEARHGIHHFRAVLLHGLHFLVHHALSPSPVKTPAGDHLLQVFLPGQPF